jgi:hypothetical protein
MTHAYQRMSVVLTNQIIHVSFICIRKRIQIVKKSLDFRSEVILKDRDRDWKIFSTVTGAAAGTEKSDFSDP